MTEISGKVSSVMPQITAGAVTVKGKDGASAYEVAVKNGYQGTESEWLASLKGDPGDKGDTGTVDLAGKGLAINVDNAGIMHFIQAEE